MIESTSKFKVEKIIFNDGDFAIALGYWEGKPELATACRWHEAGGIGYPQTFGKPQWMVLPESRVDIHDATNPAGAKVSITFG
ncbi:hypothetical protein NJC38_21955 [Pseudomonas sp. 21LCFQ010]|uniref:hypothetical protein n=1 Tax=Pseudomonas sp. 21LCFQ010 TaxID=2957506 RepID=UPI00209731A0|nr:hypothetical protein [Pseudomonas sp. 21LCFQ010]MCO8164806.1 hypothetical protein [Pseudomonas sp. 21LCFQ010]